MSAEDVVKLPASEQERRRRALLAALVQVRLSGLEPHPAFFEYVERYARGAITIEEAIAHFTALIARTAVED